MIEAIIGALAGILTIVFARMIKGESWLYSLGLLTLPGLYAFYALLDGESAVGVKEMVFGIPYVLVGLACAFVNIRMSAVLVGALWILHGVFDLTRSHFIVNTGVPDWYPVWCAALDVVVGVYLLWLSRRVLNADLRQA